MPDEFRAFFLRGGEMPGVVLVSNRLSLGQALEDLVVLIARSHDGEWLHRLVYMTF